MILVTQMSKLLMRSEKILASSFGLATLSSVELAGQENHDNNFIIGDISADGTFFYLYAYTTGSAAYCRLLYKVVIWEL